MNHRKRVVLAVLAASFLLPLGTAEARNRSYQPPVPFAIPLTDSGRGELQSVAAAPGGGFYAAGSVQSQGEGTFSVVVRITADGTLDPAFGNGGVAATPLQLGCTSEVDLAVQAGRPVVSATVPSPTDPLDCDIALVRLNQDGSIDAGFGEAGIRVVNVNNGYFFICCLVSRDATRGLAVGPDGSLYLHASARASGFTDIGDPRADSSMWMVRLTPDGDVDTGWGDSGFRELDLSFENESARGVVVLDDGSAIGIGDGATGLVTEVQPVVYRVDPAGNLGMGFAVGGVFHQDVASVAAEAHGAAMVDGALVVAGFGQVGVVALDRFLAFRISLAGELEAGWGDAADGIVVIDGSGGLLNNTARGVVALPMGGVAVFGSTGPSEPFQDASFFILDRNGVLDSRYGASVERLEFGSGGSEQFRAGAYNDGRLLLVGNVADGSNSTVHAWGALVPITAEPVFRSGFEAL